MPTRVQLSRSKGWRMPPDTISVARPGHWGNPFDVATFGRERAIKLFENSVRGYWSPGLFADGEPGALVSDAYRRHCAFRNRHSLDEYRQLRGVNLACWCKPGELCHADVLLRLANEGLY